jgi:hypothetical protein
MFMLQLETPKWVAEHEPQMVPVKGCGWLAHCGPLEKHYGAVGMLHAKLQIAAQTFHYTVARPGLVRSPRGKRKGYMIRGAADAERGITCSSAKRSMTFIEAE